MLQRNTGMRTIKSKPANYKKTGFLIGLNIALLAILWAFNFKTISAITAFEIPIENFTDSIFTMPIVKEKIEPQKTNIDKVKVDLNNPELKIAEDSTIFENKITQISNSLNLLFDSSQFVKPKREIIFDDPTIIEEDPDERASLAGGDEGLHILYNSQFAPSNIAKETRISGTMLMTFVVEIDGSVSNIAFLGGKKRELGFGLEQEAKRVLMLTSGKWKPALKMGKPVRSYFRFPVQIDYSGF